MREQIEIVFSRPEGIPVVMRYFDPSYQVRSRPANSEDALLCDLFARHAVHAAMAGKTGVVIGFLHERFIHVPIELARHAHQTPRPGQRLVALGFRSDRTTGAVHLKFTTTQDRHHHAHRTSNYEPNDIYVLRISGILKQSEFAAEHKAPLRGQNRRRREAARPRDLVENFEGFERGADWNDLDFLLSHSGEIAKIAIVAAPRWEVQALAFAGAGVRRAPVRFFPSDQLSAARAWLTGNKRTAFVTNRRPSGIARRSRPRRSRGGDDRCSQ